VEFSRVGQGTTGVSRSFDITLTKLSDDSRVTFLSIDKEEQQVLMAYFKQSGIKTRFLDADGAQREALDSASEEEGGQGRRARGKKPDAAAIDADMDDDESEEDEDFVDNGSGDSNEDEDGEEEQDEDDMSMIDEGIDKDELKALQ